MQAHRRDIRRFVIICASFIILAAFSVLMIHRIKEIREYGKAVDEAENSTGIYYRVEPPEYGSFQYLNSKCEPIHLSNDVSVTIGASTDCTDYLILDPQVISSSPSDRFGIYILSDQAWNLEYKVIPDYSHENLKYLTKQGWDEFVREDQTLVWRDTQTLQEETPEDAEIYIRVVDISRSTIVGTIKFEVSFDAGKFTLAPPSSCEDTSSFAVSHRKPLMEDAIDFLVSTGVGILADELEIDKDAETVWLERVKEPYFEELLDSKNKLLNRQKINGWDLLAVSFTASLGPVTVYFIPDYVASAEGIECSITPRCGYVPIAYDFLCPFTTNSLLIPHSHSD